MAYATGYEYDIFISYASVDDIGPAGDAAGWVSGFVRDLERVLASRLRGQKPTVYFDRRDLQGNHALEEIIASVRRSALFLSIVSPAYVTRPWTRKELAAFVEDDAGGRRLFAIDYLPLDDGEAYPPPLDDRKRLKFWERTDDVSQIARPLRGRDQLYDKIHDLAEQIRRQLMAINDAADIRPAIGRAADIVADDAARRANGIVYLAQTTEDLEDERAQVQRHLEQFSFLVLPSADLPGGGAAFRAAAEADIEQADLYVHLLGPRGGRSPADLPEGYGRAQIEAATAAGKTMLLWRHPELNVEAVTDPRQKALLSDPHVVASGLQQFTEEIRRRLTVRKKPPPATSPHSLVFINAIKNDHQVAKIVQQEFAARQMSVAIPLFEGSAKDVEDDLTENMRDCDVMIFIYGEAPLTWVRGQMRRFHKIRPSPPVKVLAVFEGPPDKGQTDIDFVLPQLRHIRFSEGWSVERLRDVISEIEA